MIDKLGEERSDRLHYWYVGILSSLFPKDQDGDGFPDAVERYEGTQPDNPSDHPESNFLANDMESADSTGFEAYDFMLHRAWDILLLQPGERRHMHLRVGIRGHSVSFARGVRWLLMSDSAVLLSLPGEGTARQSLLVPVTVDGFMDFDLVAPPDAQPLGDMGKTEVRVTCPMGNVDNDVAIAKLSAAVASRLPPLPCSTKEVAIQAVAEGEGDYYFAKGKRLIEVAWEPTGLSGPCYIEATRDEAGRDWRVVTLCKIEYTREIIAYELHDSPSGYRGPLRFRVMPTKPASPEE